MSFFRRSDPKKKCFLIKASAELDPIPNKIDVKKEFFIDDS
jgi:hypothetical protein